LHGTFSRTQETDLSKRRSFCIGNPFWVLALFSFLLENQSMVKRNMGGCCADPTMSMLEKDAQGKWDAVNCMVYAGDGWIERILVTLTEMSGNRFLFAHVLE